MTPTKFFYENAGCSYHPAVETEQEGRRRGAESLAIAEEVATLRGWCCRWTVDLDIDSSEFDDSSDPWALWICELLDGDGERLQTLGGIDFGRDGDPWGDDYRRVVEAELALQTIMEEPA